ncbi:MAG: hypothetical protein ACM3S2_02480 [Ignavibacteriales bacterium]
MINEKDAYKRTIGNMSGSESNLKVSGVNAGDNTFLSAGYFCDELNMLQAVRSTLYNHNHILITIPDFIDALGTFEDYINQITDMYKDARKQLVHYISKFARAIKTYAVMTENGDLIEETSIKESDCEIMHNDDLLNLGKNILEYARMYMQSPNPFGIFNQTFEDCENVIDNFSYAIDRSGSGVFEKNRWKDMHDALYSQAHDLLNNTIDKMSDTLKANHPEFYREYQASRIINKTTEAALRNPFDAG